MTTTMEKVEKLNLEHAPTVQALPDAAKTEAGILLEVDEENAGSLQLARDGHTVLLPQPTSDPGDPLNWSWSKKHLILFTVAWGSLCADFTSATGSATLIVQAVEWEISPNHVGQNNSLNILLMGLGGLFWVPMVSYFGRAPVLFWTTLIAFVFVILSVNSTSFTMFYTVRALQGLFITAPQTISIAFIKDMFFFHERARKIGLWACLYIASPYIGPCLSNFILQGTGSWRDCFWMGVGVVGLQLIFILAFVDETFYNRDLSQGSQPSRPSSLQGRLSRILGFWQLRNSSYYISFLQAYKRLILVLIKPAFYLIAFLIFAWAIGINITTAILFATPEKYGGYGYSYNGVGFLYFIPIVAIFIGEVFGHFFNDFMARRYIHKHGGVFEAEARLTTLYIAAVAMIAGLVLIGQTLEKELSVAGVIFGWGLSAFGVMVNSVATQSYALDSYPLAPAEVAGWVQFARVAGGFSVGYYQQPWGAKVGYAATFGTQAGIVAFSLIAVVALQIWGRKLRLSAGTVQ
ncbi:hypothetical protein ANO11243_071410 [Dothideomycetidae sp. 11243]|nr:hypothetical protein ANO11243_071410 [fungal sp. No.11243]